MAAEEAQVGAGSEDRKETFLGRWSRVKSEARDSAAEDPQALGEPAHVGDAPALPPLDALTIDSDFSGFFHPKVDEDLRRSALRKLFSDPHFNVMDGLDVYIDDYSKTEAIPAAMLAGLKQAQRILAWAAEKHDDPASTTDGARAVQQMPTPRAELPDETASGETDAVATARVSTQEGRST